MSFPMTSGLMHGDKSCASVWEWCRCWGRENAVRSLCEFGWMTTLSPTSALWDEKGTQLRGGKIWGKKKNTWVNGSRTPVDVTVGKRLHLHTGWHDDTNTQGGRSPPWAAQQGWHMHCMKLAAGALLWVKVALQRRNTVLFLYPPPPEWTRISKSLRGWGIV